MRLFCVIKMELVTGLEPATCSLRMSCTTNCATQATIILYNNNEKMSRQYRIKISHEIIDIEVRSWYNKKECMDDKNVHYTIAVKKAIHYYRQI